MAVTNANAHVLYRQSGPVGVITINNPPVNALAKQVRLSVAELIELAQDDPGTKALVICGSGRNFCGGADIREFNTPDRQVLPMTRHLMNIVEASAKPVVAAIHGPTLGGGLELALGCHYRIVDPDAQLGLPEVHRGVIPGASGTQRLPRLVGFRKGLEMIVGGTPVDAETALEIGLVDRIAGLLIWSRARWPMPTNSSNSAPDRAGSASGTSTSTSPRAQRSWPKPMRGWKRLPAASAHPSVAWKAYPTR